MSEEEIDPADGIATHHYPSQMSAWIADSSTQLSVALERSHAVASLSDGTLDVVQHRRGGPFNGNGGTVVRFNRIHCLIGLEGGRFMETGGTLYVLDIRYMVYLYGCMTNQHFCCVLIFPSLLLSFSPSLRLSYSPSLLCPLLPS